MHLGRCLCGTIRFEVAGPVVALVHCHCSMCRKHHGTAYVTWAVAAAGGFRVTEGRDAIARFASSTGFHRSFCTTCGSVAPEIAPSGEHVLIPAGSLQGALGITPQLHMFVASKASWFTIADSLPQHAEYPPEYGMCAVERPAIDVTSGQVQGSCLCGGVAYEIGSPALRLMYCHCSRCRLARGAAFATNAFFDTGEFRWSRGEDLVAHYALPGAERFGVAFCSRCGSAVPRVARERNVVSVPAGTLDHAPGLMAPTHIFVESRADWDVPTEDDIPRFAAMPPHV